MEKPAREAAIVCTCVHTCYRSKDGQVLGSAGEWWEVFMGWGGGVKCRMVVGSADGEVGSEDGVVGSADNVVESANGVVGSADSAVGRADGVVGSTNGVVGCADGEMEVQMGW